MARRDRFRNSTLVQRLPAPKVRGRRDIIAIILLVVPLVAIGYYLAAIEVAVDPPPGPIATPTVPVPPATGPRGTPATPAASPEGAPASPVPAASGRAPSALSDAPARPGGMVLASES